MTTAIIEYNMFDGTKKTEITKEDQINVESVTIQQILTKEETMEYLKNVGIINSYIYKIEKGQNENN